MSMIVQRHMGDYSLDIIKGALDEIIAILKKTKGESLEGLLVVLVFGNKPNQPTKTQQ